MVLLCLGTAPPLWTSPPGICCYGSGFEGLAPKSDFLFSGLGFRGLVAVGFIGHLTHIQDQTSEISMTPNWPQTLHRELFKLTGPRNLCFSLMIP